MRESLGPTIEEFPLRCAHCAHMEESTEGLYCRKQGGSAKAARVTAYGQGATHPCVEFQVVPYLVRFIHSDTMIQINQWIKKHRMSENTPKGMMAK